MPVLFALSDATKQPSLLLQNRISVSSQLLFGKVRWLCPNPDGRILPLWPEHSSHEESMGVYVYE